ncbi:MAG: PAS-domain containing protein [Bradyrhizobiaceae bacterium]|nr:PAS-domain containing protein [Bradyrhizobiaceae bacterium]
MPDHIRSGTACFSMPRRPAASKPLVAAPRAVALAVVVALSVLAVPVPAHSHDPWLSSIAYASTVHVEAVRGLDVLELTGLALFFGALISAAVTAVLLVRTREVLRHERGRARSERAALDAEIDRLYALLQSEPQVIVAWGRDAKPVIIGEPAAVAPEIAPNHLMSFATWLKPGHASRLQAAVERLSSRGEAFSLPVTTGAGRHVAVEGRAIGGNAILRFHDVSGLRKDIVELTARLQQQQAVAETQRALLEAIPSPVWIRDAGGRLTFVNAAYARAAGVTDPASAVVQARELLDSSAREAAERQRAGGHAWIGRTTTVNITGTRYVFDAIETPTPHGSAGIAREVTELDALRSELASTMDAHRRTLDQLSTGVAIFGPDHNLVFCNSAYRTLWEIDAAFLDGHPSDSAVIDRLRAARRLPEQRDFRAWKAQLHSTYRTGKPATYEWHLPDQRTLRVVASPGPDGGVTYLFDDVTERLNLERRHDALTRVQGVTLDNLAEAVALFSSDGRVRLHNPAFAKMWQLSPDLLGQRPHIEAMIERFRTFHRDHETWQSLRVAVTAIDSREPVLRRIERIDGSVVNCRTVRLPDGATLLAFQDVTDSVKVERALTEHNIALEQANKIKTDFVRHVSYELRQPLTNIIGFAHLLGDAATGPLTTKQAEYVGYIAGSSNALLAIIDNILDLASIGAGAVTLDLDRVDIRATMAAAVEGVQDRLVKNDIALKMRVPRDIGHFVADERRIRQILFNLLSNAIGFSPPGGTVVLAAERGRDEVSFTVQDHGPGIPGEFKDKVFELFESRTEGTDHRGAGLGLSIVRSFVELHHGSVRIDSVPGQGTTVVCTFPLAAQTARNAAE